MLELCCFSWKEEFNVLFLFTVLKSESLLLCTMLHTFRVVPEKRIVTFNLWRERALLQMESLELLPDLKEYMDNRRVNGVHSSKFTEFKRGR